MKLFYSLIKRGLLRRIRVSVMQVLALILSANSANSQCVTAQSIALFPSCGNTELRIDASQPGVEYSLINAATGVKVGGNVGQGNGGSVSVGFALVSAAYFVRAKKPGCADSVDFGNTMINVVQPPTPQTLTGGGFYCWEIGGVNIGLASSEIGVQYQLFKDGSGTGITRNGTGAAISFGSQTETGTYSVEATRTECSGVSFGNVVISDRIMLPFSEGFNASGFTGLPSCWSQEQVSGSSSLSMVTNTTLPTTTPFEGSKYIFWNSAGFSTGNKTRLISPNISSVGNGNVEVEFYFYVQNDPAFSTKNDGVQVQYNIDGTWQNAGNLILRHDASLTAGTSQWKKFTVTLPGEASNQDYLQIGLEFVSALGRNCSLDALTIKYSNSCQTAQNITIGSITSFSAQVSFNGNGNYIVEYGLSGFFTPGTGPGAGVNGTVINTSSSPVNLNLASGSFYDVYIRKLCGPGIYTANSQKVTFASGCLPYIGYPIVEDFESVSTPLPVCWTGIDADNSGYTWALINNYPVHSGNKSVGVYTNSTSNKYLVLPQITLSGQRLKYWVQENTGYEIRLSTTGKNPQDFTTVVFSEVLSSPTNNFVERKIDLSGYSGTVYLAFHNIPSQFSSTILDDISIENLPACVEPTYLKSSSTNNSVSLTWIGTGNFIVEYGAPGFTPGTGATAGPGGTITTSTTNLKTITGLVASTQYDFYVRKNCGGNGFSINSKISAKTFINCGTATPITLCTPITANIPAGSGTMDFFGQYPINSMGPQTEGRELLYTFTPASTGVYYVEVTSTASDPIHYFYKPVSAGCGNTGWTGVGIFYSSSSPKMAIGMLTAGTAYYILLDNPGTVAKSQTFRICKATVGVPNVQQCQTYSAAGYISANSPKEEYIIDYAGNVIAALDFSTVNSDVGFVSVSQYSNNGSVRRDSRNREYLDVNYSISASFASPSPFGIKLFFTNNDLNDLINEPNDGIADVSDINDLRISRLPEACGNGIVSNVVGIPLVLNQTTNGFYDANSKYVQFTTPLAGSFFIHGPTNSPLEQDFAICSSYYLNFEYSYGYDLQWQVDDGNGFVNLVNNTIYNGANSGYLYLNNPPANFAGFKYRCVATAPGITIISSVKILKFENSWLGLNSSDWNDASNWSCNAIPNEGADVILNPGVPNMPVVNSNVTVRSLTVKQGATVTVTSGFKLEIKGK